MGVPPMAVMVRAFPLGEGQTRRVASGPMLILHITSAAFPRAASRIKAIVTILLASSIRVCLVLLRSRPIRVVVESWHGIRGRYPMQTSVQTFIIHWAFSCNVCAIPHKMMRVSPVAVTVRAFPLGELEASLVATGPMLVLQITSAAFSRAAARIAAIVTILCATVVHKILVVIRRSMPVVKPRPRIMIQRSHITDLR